MRCTTFSIALLACSLLACFVHAAENMRPNILWLVCEDASVEWIGCYGNREANTPNIDALAQHGFRYTHAYSSAPVCATQRSTWITGINSLSLGTHPMRSRYSIPHEKIKYYPDYLRQAGYFTANHSKTDYNIGGRADQDCWDSKSAQAWKERKPGQPFFQVLNFEQSHESRAHGDVNGTRHSPQQVTLKKYHPDELDIRKTYAKYYDAIETMDAEIGKALKQLKDNGLAEDTIIIFNSDHGGVLPRSKRFLYDSGVHVPLLVSIPEKFKHLWPAEVPGKTVDRLVSFLDFPKSWLSLTQAEIPSIMQGRIFLGPKAEPEPAYVFSFRERMDERFDSQRSVRDKRFAYIKNYMPFVHPGQHLNYLWKMKAMLAWEEAHRNQRTNEITGKFFQPKPVEELYDCVADPDNVVNLADQPEHKQTLETMRAKLREWQLAIRDSGLMPEMERERRATEHKLTIYEMVRDPKLYNLPAYLDAADLALAKHPAHAEQFLDMLRNQDSAIRYWGTVGLFSLGKPSAASQQALLALLDDSCGEVAVMAAWALFSTSEVNQAQQAMLKRLQQHDPASLWVLNMLDWSNSDLAPYQAPFAELAKGKGKMAEYEQRMVEYLRRPQ